MQIEAKVMPGEKELKDAAEALLRALSFFTKSPVASEKILKKYSALDAAEDLHFALTTFQDAVPGYALNFIEKIDQTKILQKGRIIGNVLKSANSFIKFFK